MSGVDGELTAIGPFIVRRKLGEGAMGVVYAGYDEKLGRKVALKLVRRELLDRPAVRERMHREAQAMACLSNPHVVQVYQVGEHAGGIYVAMEYIDGQTLGDWLKARPRSWQEVLRVVCEAGRGLAAAHAAGLVHRDFKPDNVLVDANDHARVLDFGLVQSGVGSDDDLARTTEDTPTPTISSEEVDRSNIHWSVRLTQLGKAIGTPAYMSPEQHFGEAVGPYSDQFSFSVTLYEALYGSRPFVGDTWASIKAQIERGVVPSPLPESRVPRRLFKILARGLANHPARRWPSMDEMLGALGRDPQRARLRMAAMAGLIAAASAGSYAVAAARVPAEERCNAGAREVATTWGETQRAAVAQAFVATGAPFAADAWQRVEQRLDGYASGWAQGHDAACESHAAGLQSAALLDLRTACLGRRKVHMHALIDVFMAADRDVVENAVQAVAALPSVQACSDAETLLAAVPPPDDPHTAAEVEALRERLARGAALEATGGYAVGLELVTRVRVEAKTLGYAPLTAEAALAEGSLLTASARPQDAAAALADALRLAIAHDLHAIAAEAAARRLFVVGEGLGEHTAALATQPFAEALVERARDDGRISALLANNLGTIFDLHGDDAAARVHYERTIALLRRAEVTDPLLAVAHHNLANIDLEGGDLEAARRNSAQAHTLFVTLLGERHPLVAHPLAGLADVALQQGALAEASERYEQALALMQSAHGTEHPYLLHPLTGLGRVAARLGQVDEARRRFDRVVAIAERNDYVHPQLAEALEGLGELAAADGDPAKARGLFERAVQVYGEDRVRLAPAALRAGQLAAALGDPAGAISWFERILAGERRPLAGDPTRISATLELARLLSARAETGVRACALWTSARDAMPADDPRRTSAAGLADRCR